MRNYRNYYLPICHGCYTPGKLSTLRAIAGNAWRCSKCWRVQPPSTVFYLQPNKLRGNTLKCDDCHTYQTRAVNLIFHLVKGRFTCDMCNARYHDGVIAY